MIPLKNLERLHEFSIPPGTIITVVWEGCSASVSNGNMTVGITAAKNVIFTHGMAEARERFNSELGIFKKYSKVILAKGVFALPHDDLSELCNCIVACCVWDYAINGNFIKISDISSDMYH